MRISDWSSDVCSSDLYGSDAIAGTINVITKHDYQGITLDAQYGISEAGDGRDFRIRGLDGYNFAGGRGNITVAGEYNQEAGLTNFERAGKRLRWDERRVGTECVSTGSSRVHQYHSKKKI